MISRHIVPYARRQLGRALSSSSSKDEHSSQLSLAHSTSSLGIWEACVSKPPAVLQAIQQLPEVESAIRSFHQPNTISSSVIYSLERAVQIFGSMKKGGDEHTACLFLLAEIQCRANNSVACCNTLQELIGYCSDDELGRADPIKLAMAKVHWLNGEHATAKEICDSLVGNTQIEPAARTGQAVSRLLLVSTLDDVFSVRDPFRMVVKQLERTTDLSSTALAAAHLNMGVAEAVYAETVSKHNNVDVPLDGAMRSWRQGLTTLKKSSRVSTVRANLQARLQTNMAWGMLQMTRERDYIQRASEFASGALAVYDKLRDDYSNKEGLGRTLSLLATCYQKSGAAVTAQGLFQSAMDQPASSPLQKLERRDALIRYADLCREWEKRERDAEKLVQQADDLDASLPDGWRGKSAIHGSLWFWTPAIFRH
jgi:hypothetical protein